MWTSEEHHRMLEGLRLYKRDWAKVTRFVGTRTPAQVRSHAQKYFDKVVRDKTDEYVPRARPKRKSSTPYPRKLREQGKSVARFQQTHAFQVPVVHPSSSLDVPVYTQHVQSVQHTIPIAPSQSPVMSTVPPYMQPEQMSRHVVQRVYSPYSDNHHRQTIHATPEIQNSPISYLGGQPYAHSPSIPQQTITVPTPMFGVLSPMTSASYFTSSRTPSVTHTPVTVYGQQDLMSPNMQMPAPRHSHPEGPNDNCAKCAALQRYGAVLQEIGELNTCYRPLDHLLHAGRGPPCSSPEPGGGRMRAQRRRDLSRDHHIFQDNREAPSSYGSLSPKRNRQVDPSPPHSDERVERLSHTAPAGNRAHRAKILKARKMKGSIVVNGVSQHRPSAYEEHSEYVNSTLENRRRGYEQKRVASTQEPLTRIVDTTSKKRNISTDRYGRDTGETGKKHRSSAQHSENDKRAYNGSEREDKEPKDNAMSSVELLRRPSQKTNSNDERPSPKSDESETGPHSPFADTYSSKERMELFDAVHSLQILAKTSSSGSPSSRSKGDLTKK